MNSEQKVVVDLSCGGYRKNGKVISWLSSNFIHMYENKKDLLAQAPGFIGFPHSMFGAGIIEGTPQEIHKFFGEFLKEYDEPSTKREVWDILHAVDRGCTMVRCYHVVWPDRFEPEHPDSLMWARAMQVLIDELRGAGIGHVGSHINGMRLRATDEILRLDVHAVGIQFESRYGFDPSFTYTEIGFDWHCKYPPLNDDFVRLQKHMQEIANRFEPRIEELRAMMANDPRYKSTK